jgi:hypothetical protein
LARVSQGGRSALGHRHEFEEEEELGEGLWINVSKDNMVDNVLLWLCFSKALSFSYSSSCSLVFLYYVVLGEEGSEGEGKGWCWLCGGSRARAVCDTSNLVDPLGVTIRQICTSQGGADVDLGSSSV